MKSLTTKLTVLLFVLFSSSVWAQIPLTFNVEHSAYEVGTLADLVWLSDNSVEWDEHYVQVADIDAAATGVDGSAYWNGGAGFSPIGNLTVEFTGNFSNASSFTISNLHINRATHYIGLFGSITNAKLSGIHLVNPNVSGYSEVGTLVGKSNDSLIKDCSAVNVSVTGLNVGVYGTQDSWINPDSLGGLIGWSNSSIILSSSVEGSLQPLTPVPTNAWNIGGFIGYSTGAGFISDCVADVDVTIGSRRIGGFIGHISVGIEGVTIQSCASLGDVTSIESQVGGFIGQCNITYADVNIAQPVNTLIKNCYSTGSSTGNGHVGGFVGFSEGFHFQHCYTVSDISNALGPGGFVGWNGILNTYDSIFYETNGFNAGIKDSDLWSVFVGDSFNLITNLSTSQMGVETNFTDWDFTNIWQIDNGFPTFRDIVSPPTANDIVDDIVDVLNAVVNLPSNSLTNKVTNAIKKTLDKNPNNDKAAINVTEAFMNQVEAQRDKKFTNTEADSLLALGQELLDVLNL